MKRIVLVFSFFIFYSFSHAQDWDKLYPSSLNGKVRLLNYPGSYEAQHIIKFVDTKEEADVWIAMFDTNDPTSRAQYDQIQDKRYIWLAFNEGEFTDTLCTTLAVYNCVHKNVLKDYYRIIKVKIVPYGQQGINKANPNNVLFRTESNPDPELLEYLDKANY